MNWRNFLPTRNPAYLMAGLIISWGLFSTLFGERLPYNDGFGWDGMYYRSITMHLWEHNDEVTMYHGKRCLPCVAIHYTLRAFGLPVEDEYVFQAFRLYNLLFFVVILFTLVAICKELSIGIQGQWLTLLGFSCNYFCLKIYNYAPIAVDVWALAFSTLALLAYFKQQRLLVIGWTFVGSFTWAILPIFGGLLILFPFAKPNAVAPSRPSKQEMSRWALVGAALAAGVIATYTAYVVWVLKFFGIPPGSVTHWALPLSLGCLALFLFGAFKELLNGGSLIHWRDVVSLDFLGRVAVLAATFALLSVCYVLLQPYFATRRHMPNQMAALMQSICAWSVAKPFLFILGQIVYYGPSVILMVIFWRPMAGLARHYGTGIALATALGLLMSLCTEPRYFMVFFPLFLVLLSKVMEAQSWGLARLAAFAILGIFMSKVWLPLNWGPWPREFQYEDVFHFPMQIFFMSFGIWMNTTTYAIQAGVAVAAALWIRYVLVPNPSARVRSGEATEAERNEVMPEAA